MGRRRLTRSNLAGLEAETAASVGFALGRDAVAVIVRSPASS